jgi:glycosyltransferase involved in cell wall biosynthesis
MITTTLSAFPDEDTGQCRDDPVVNVIQDGARLHYALPVALQRQGILGTVFTDWFVRPGSREDRIAHLVRRFAPDLGRRLADRCCPELDGNRVMSSNGFALYEWLARARPGKPEERYARLSKKFAGWVGRLDWRSANAIIGFVRNIDPALCAAARKRGLVTVVDQMIAPAAVQAAEAHRQAMRWPDWHRTDAWRSELMLNIERRTWALADHIACPSNYVRDGLLQQGVPPDRITVIPYPIDSARFRFVDRSGRDGALVVGFVGAVGLRKGAPAFFEVARSFNLGEARFVMIGPIEPETRLIAAQKGRVELNGAVPRSQVLAWLERFDVLLFPSTCEGSSGAVMEAMATGLPIITTPNSGSIVRNGIEGFICSCNDVSSLVQSVDGLRNNPELRLRMGRAAHERARIFDLDRYGLTLDLLFRQLIKQQKEQPASVPSTDALDDRSSGYFRASIANSRMSRS